MVFITIFSFSLVPYQGSHLATPVVYAAPGDIDDDLIPYTSDVDDDNDGIIDTDELVFLENINSADTARLTIASVGGSQAVTNVGQNPDASISDDSKHFLDVIAQAFAPAGGSISFDDDPTQVFITLPDGRGAATCCAPGDDADDVPDAGAVYNGFSIGNGTWVMDTTVDLTGVTFTANGSFAISGTAYGDDDIEILVNGTSLGNAGTVWYENAIPVNFTGANTLLNPGVNTISISVTNSASGLTGAIFDLDFQVGDTDGDGIIDSQDLDSDNDGISDLYEAGNATLVALDTAGNSNGFIDLGETAGVGANGLATEAGAGTTPVNSFGADEPDYLDLDSDDDGIPDSIEGQATATYLQYPATVDTTADSDDDGILDIYDANAVFGGTVGTFVNPNTDASDGGDTTPDYLDTDSDGDGSLDSAESGVTLTPTYANPDGAVTDSASIFATFTNIDSDATDVDFRSLLACPSALDSDGDGLTDCEETTGVDDAVNTPGLSPTGTSSPTDPCDPTPGAIAGGDCDDDGNQNSTDPNPTTPTAVNDATSTTELTAVTYDILANDDFLDNADGANLGTTTIVRDATTPGTAAGTIAFNATTGELTYTPTAGESGTSPTVGYEVCNTDPNPDSCATALVTITVTCSSATDTDADGLTDCEETTGTDDPVNTPGLSPTGTSSPTDPCDPTPGAIAGGDCDDDGNQNSTDPNPTTPTAVNDSTTTTPETLVTYDVLNNDDYIDDGGAGNLGTTTLAQDGGNPGTATGVIVFDATTGSITYTPTAAEKNTSVTIGYEVCNDASGGNVCATAVLTINVNTPSSGSSSGTRRVTKFPTSNPSSPTIVSNDVCPIFTQHLKLGDKDGNQALSRQEIGVSSTINEVRKLQTALTHLGFYNGPINGSYGPLTKSAVDQWQVANRTQVLDPWNLDGPTGWFYQSSERWMNISLGCNDAVVLDTGTFLGNSSSGYQFSSNEAPSIWQGTLNNWQAFLALSGLFGTTTTTEQPSTTTQELITSLRAQIAVLEVQIAAALGNATNTVNTIIPVLGDGNLCSAEKILSENMHIGAEDGQYQYYNRGIVTEVLTLQQHLNRLGFSPEKFDGKFGPLTDTAVKQMQTVLGLVKIDGKIGPNTRAQINNSC